MCDAMRIAFYCNWTIFTQWIFDLYYWVLASHSLHFPFVLIILFKIKVTQAGCLARPVGQISGCRTVSRNGATSTTMGLGSRPGARGGHLVSHSSSGSCLLSRVNSTGEALHTQVRHDFVLLLLPSHPGCAKGLFSLSHAQLRSCGDL